MARQFPRFRWDPKSALADLQARIVATAASPALHTQDQLIVKGWLSALRILDGVPFNYLVPDSRMLPTESLRFFTVDPNWILALLDGALSVGKAPGSQSGLSGLEAAAPPVSGFLLRSATVTSWPGLQVTAYADAGGTEPLTTLSLQTLAPAVLMGLFAGTMSRLDLQEPSEGLHFGVDNPQPEPTAAGQYTKTLRSVEAGNPGELLSTQTQAVVRTAGSHVLAIHPLATEMMSALQVQSPAFSAAEFGMEMLQGVQIVTFDVQSTEGAS